VVGLKCPIAAAAAIVDADMFIALVVGKDGSKNPCEY